MESYTKIHFFLHRDVGLAHLLKRTYFRENAEDFVKLAEKVVGSEKNPMMKNRHSTSTIEKHDEACTRAKQAQDTNCATRNSIIIVNASRPYLW